MRCLLLSYLLASCSLASAQSPDLEKRYIDAWKAFYPSKAVQLGMHDQVHSYDDLSLESVGAWLALQKELLPQCIDLRDSENPVTRINAIHLGQQIKSEIYKWEGEAPHKKQLTLYTDLISKAIGKVAQFDFLPPIEKEHVVSQRKFAVQNLCRAAIHSLQMCSTQDIQQGQEHLTKTRADLDESLQDFSITIEWIDSLSEHVQRILLPIATEDPIGLGRAAYAEKLAIYTDDAITPEDLEAMALEEIQLTKELMADIAGIHFQKKHPGKAKPEADQLIDLALADMEKDVTSNAREYTAFWQDLADSLIEFISVHDLATLPQNQTLSITPAPESVGPAARIGWVASSPPFAANPWTTLYLPSIPDTLPEQEQKDFWASFNKPFNRMIAIHELYPGHYVQIKISRETPHTIRLLFPYGPYIEGWATFTEKILLDAGWDADKPLTMLAHLRKRLENANRAYTSVMVHCHDWDIDQVMQHSTTEALLAPQFAKSLWGRLLRGPMQMTSYFFGGKQFREMYQAERERQGSDFVLKDFMDLCMRTGPIPILEFPALMGAN